MSPRRDWTATFIRGVANLGHRPTIAGGTPERLLELHLFDLDREIYGEEVEVRFVRYLRPEKKFEDIEGARRADRGRR